MSTKALKQQLIAAIAMVLVAGIALASSTYAWFVNNATVTATGAQVTSSTAYSLLITKELKGDGTDWQTTKALNPNSGLTPVSTIGTKDASGLEGKTANGTATATIGDIRFVASNEWKDNKVINYDEVNKASYASYNTGNSTGILYYYTDTVYLKAGQASNVYLDSSTTGLVWNGVYTTFDNFMNGKAADGSTALSAYSDGDTDKADNCSLAEAQALVKTLRVGMQVTPVTSNPTASTDDVTARNTARKDGKFYVYQLNRDLISNEVITTTQNNANGVTAAIGPKSDDSRIESSAGIANLNTDDNTTITAFANLVSDAVPVITDMMVEGDSTGIVANVAKNGTVSKSIAAVTANDIVEVDIYIWMEGCDGDVAAVNLDKFNSAMIPGIRFGFCLGNDVA